MGEAVHHPQHYGGDTTYEAIKVIDAWGLGFCLGNTVKYISRAGKKDPLAEIEDLKKALWYLAHHIEQLELQQDAGQEPLVGVDLVRAHTEQAAQEPMPGGRPEWIG